MPERNEGRNSSSNETSNSGSNPNTNPKDNADVPPVLPSEQQTASEAGGVLSPEDLDISDSPYVSEISDGRYVVSADKSSPNVPDKSESLPSRKSQSSAPAGSGAGAGGNRNQDPSLEADAGRSHGGAGAPADRPGPNQGQGQGQGQGQDRRHPREQAADRGRGAGAPIQSPETARSVLADELERVDARYAVDIVSRFGNETVRHRMTSDDVLDTFNSLVFWYARNVARDTRTDRAASLLFAKSDFDAPLSEPQVRTALREHGLDESDSIEDLLESLE
ncbi:DUF7500 family protein [Halobiforma nitratireducens]|uniref:Flagella cluster protein n=1 Tax=Halobiforma nitratireducens JCM 10879 TaxID=1227454 RepID=M0LFT6_9EURY|nr:hypothetical protein [Halobiforma nitratireducens]EMA32406.1 flagella cluster protein [Halobiforma nitratireducens JCM 10879]